MKINRHMKQIGDLKDRGTIKWQGMFLNEHREMLKEWYEEDNQDKKPELDDFDMQLIQEEIELAMKSKCTVRLKSWKDNKFHYHIGTIERVDTSSRTIFYDDPFGTHRLPFDEVVAVLMID